MDIKAQGLALQALLASALGQFGNFSRITKGTPSYPLGPPKRTRSSGTTFPGDWAHRPAGTKIARMAAQRRIGKSNIR